MGYTASSVATVPAINGLGQEFQWFIFLLTGGWQNDIRDEIQRNFDYLAEEIGTENLLVKGTDPGRFYQEVIRQYFLHLKGIDEGSIPLPALLVTDTVPAKVTFNDGEVNARVIIFPLAEALIRDGILTDFLRKLSSTLKDTEAFDDIKELGEKKIIEKWGWIPRYCTFKPKFFGFEIDFSAILEDLMKNLEDL
jgi:hypothetical protein